MRAVIRENAAGIVISLVVAVLFATGPPFWWPYLAKMWQHPANASSDRTSAHQPEQSGLLLTSADMDSVQRGTWNSSPLKISNPLVVQGTTFQCFPLPSGAAWSKGVLFHEESPKNIFVGEIVERFRNESDAIAAFDKFATGTNGCSYTSSQNKTRLRFTWMRVTGLPRVASASQVWNAVIQQGSRAPTHGGSQFAVRYQAVDTFGWDNVDTQHRPYLTDIERRLIVVLAARLMAG